MFKYTESEELALTYGFEEVIDENAFNGRYFVKDNLIWIHDISALKRELKIFLDSKLKDLGYDVDMYRTINLPKKVNKHSTCCTEDFFNDDDMVYLSDGVYISADECWF